MEFQARSAEPNLVQAPFHDIESGHLLGYKEDLLTINYCSRDQVDDGLRLTRSRRPLDHQIVTANGFQKRNRLRTVRIDYLSEFAVRVLVIEQLVILIRRCRRLETNVAK